MFPSSRTTILSALAMVLRRYAMTITVLPAQRVPTALWMSVSFSGSSEAVASSRRITGGVFQEGARDGEALALPSGKSGAVLAQHRVEPLGKPLDELHAVRRPRRFRHFFINRSLATDSDVVCNRVVEKDHVLEDNRYVREPRFFGELGDILARAEDPAAVRLPEFRRQLGAGRLARAARSDERGDSSFLRVEADAVKDLLVAVPEPDVSER